MPITFFSENRVIHGMITRNTAIRETYEILGQTKHNAALQTRFVNRVIQAKYERTLLCGRTYQQSRPTRYCDPLTCNERIV